MSIELRSLLGLIHTILSTESSVEREEGISQLNDVFEENGLLRLQKSQLYYTGDYDEDPCFLSVGHQEFNSPLEKCLFTDGLSHGRSTAWWEKLEHIDEAYLAYNEDNHHLFEHLSQKEIEALLGDEYDAYLESRGEGEDADA